jgi:hypothetical protein
LAPFCVVFLGSYLGVLGECFLGGSGSRRNRVLNRGEEVWDSFIGSSWVWLVVVVLGYVEVSWG